MRVADYIFKTLADKGVKHCFLVTGGGAMHLNDALGHENRIKYVCCLHEQACAMAAEGYARASGTPGVICVTTGPGGTNALTGVMGAWLDSVPMVIVSGQIKRATMITACPDIKLRQLGDQEYNIVDAVKPMTKFAKTVMSVDEVPEVLEMAWQLCQTGRPGPVWIDVPLDIQAAEIHPPKGTVTLSATNTEASKTTPSEEQVSQLATLLKSAQRPAIIVGSGIRNAKAENLFLEVAESLNIPVLTSISGIDLIPSDHPLFFGRPGILGERPANFIMQNSDLFIVLGTRMGIRICGYAYETVARAATKVMIDVDEAELNKPTFRPDVKIHSDAGEFLKALHETLPALSEKTEWLAYCNHVKSKYPVILPEHRNRTDYVSSYVLPEAVVRHAPAPLTVVTSNGIAYTSTFQAIHIRKDMRMFSNEACASMGYGLPAAIGAAFADSSRTLACFEGDGSIQMNLQELQTLVNYNLPIKLFVYNNAGYLSIKTTQRSFFGGHFVGSEASSGVILPSFEKLASAYGLPYFKLLNNQELDTKLSQIFRTSGPVLVEVMLDPFEVLGPKAASKKLPNGQMVSAPLEDMAPFLPRDEFKANMLIPPLEGF